MLCLLGNRSVSIGSLAINEVSDGVCVNLWGFNYKVLCKDRDEVFSKLRELGGSFTQARVVIGKYIKDLVYDLDSKGIRGEVNSIVLDGTGFMIIGSELYVKTGSGLIFSGLWTSFGDMGTQSLKRLSALVLPLISVVLHVYQRGILDELYSILGDDGLSESLDRYLYDIKSRVVMT